MIFNEDKYLQLDEEVAELIKTTVEEAISQRVTKLSAKTCKEYIEDEVKREFARQLGENEVVHQLEMEVAQELTKRLKEIVNSVKGDIENNLLVELARKAMGLEVKDEIR